MKYSVTQLEIIQASYFKEKLRELYEIESENDIIRLHPAISWVRCAEETTNNNRKCES